MTSMVGVLSPPGLFCWYALQFKLFLPYDAYVAHRRSVCLCMSSTHCYKYQNGFFHEMNAG